jgi:hypothetical protein
MTPRHGAHRATTGARHGAKAGSSRVAPPGRPVTPARILACLLMEPARIRARLLGCWSALTREVEQRAKCNPAPDPARSIRAARRLLERRRQWQRGAFWNGGANWQRDAMVAAPTRPGAFQGSGPHRVQLRQRGALRNGGANGSAAPTSRSVAPSRNGGGIGSAAPFRTAARRAARRHRCGSSSAPGHSRCLFRPDRSPIPDSADHPQSLLAPPIPSPRRGPGKAAPTNRGADLRGPSIQASRSVRVIDPSGIGDRLIPESVIESVRNTHPGQRPSPRPARGAWRPFGQLRLGPVVRASDSSSSAPWRLPGRQLSSRPARPGRARAGQLQLGPWCARWTALPRPVVRIGQLQLGSHRCRIQLGPVASTPDRSSSARGAVIDRRAPCEKRRSSGLPSV